ncbi:MAG: hypothetical protein IVW36_02440 [Dehalococcoidia bacterium]|nr:hypothetical protein [Dehalococcoidia bacterium]
MTMAQSASAKATAGSPTLITTYAVAANTNTALVDIEVYGPSGRVLQDVRTNQGFTAGVTRSFTMSWPVPADAAAGAYTVRVGIFSADWRTLYHWNSNAAVITVSSPGQAPPTPTTAPPARPTSTAATPARPTITVAAPARPTNTPAPPQPIATPRPPLAGALPPLPARWPSSMLQLGMADSPGDAASLRQMAPFAFRYQYLAGGVNTGSGWANWNANGAFVTNYIQDSVANGMTPVFSYYMIAQSSPGNGQDESTGVYDNLQNAATMTAYYNDLKLFFQRAGAYPGNTVVLQVEPDLWGFIEQRASNDDAGSVPARVSSTGLPELAGLPETFAGFAQAVARLRDRYAPNVLLGYHVSTWGTGNDIALSNPPDATVDALGQKAARFFNSLGGSFDIAFAEFSDRDAAFKQFQYGDGAASWWDAGDFAREARFLAQFVAVSRKRVVMWQVPLGNTKMRAMNNTWDHYQDNRVEWLLDDPSRANLNAYVQAGVVAFLFGRGADGATCACDAAGDGVTNPAPIDGNTGTSTSADDDGGFFRQKAAAYYSAGAAPLP